MGVIFCQVIKIKQLNQERPSIILGNQKWKENDPIFISNAELIIIEKKLLKKNFLLIINLIKLQIKN